jgi:hypothetical protein
MAGILAGRSDYEKWLFSVLCTILDWTLGSYIKALVLFVGAVSFFLAYIWTITWCLFYEDKKKKTRRTTDDYYD